MKLRACMIFGLTAVIALAAVDAAAVDYVMDWTDQGLIHSQDPSERNYYPSVLYDADGFPDGDGAGDPYMMWYSGRFGGGTTLGVATSTDGITWTSGTALGLARSHHVAVVFVPGGFDATGPDGPATMYYRAYFWDTRYLYQIEAIAYAESDDGFNWHNRKPISEVGGTVIAPSPWRGSYGPVQIIFNPDGDATTRNAADPLANRYVMYYDLTTGGDEVLGLAFSADGLLWEGYSGNPVLRGTQDWETCGDPPTSFCREYVSRSHMMQHDGQYVMFYSGGHGGMDDGLGVATSPDGINWTKDSRNPIIHVDASLNKISTEPPGDCYRSSRAYTPSIVDDGTGEWKMYYGARSSSDCTPPSNYALGLMTLSVVQTVEIDVRPNNTRNQINTASRQLVPIAILGSAGFDPVDDVDPTSLRVRSDEPNAVPTRVDREDVNGDGIDDGVFHFRARSIGKPTQQECEDPDATLLLTGATYGEGAIQGTDFVTWLGPDCNF